MLVFILFILATIGMTNIMINGKILEITGVRPFFRRFMPPSSYEVFECYTCMGWWCGLIMGVVLVSHDPLVFFPCAFAGSVCSQFYIALYDFIEGNTPLVFDDEKPQE